MYYIFGEPADVFLGYFLEMSNSLKVSENLRGYSNSQEILPKTYDVQLPIYIVAGKYCETARDVYLQYVLKEKMEPTFPLVTGRLYHAILDNVVPIAKQYIYSKFIDADFDLLMHMINQREKIIEQIMNDHRADVVKLFHQDEITMVRENMRKLWNFQAIQIIASVDKVLSSFDHIGADALVQRAIPVSVEQKINGSKIGLSRQLSADALHVPQTVIMDVKTGKPQDFHSLTIAGYALAYESEYNKPVNLGCIIYPRFRKDKHVPYVDKKPFLIDDSLRLAFIKERDRKMEIVANGKDPGMPEQCSASCGFWNICHRH